MRRRGNSWGIGLGFLAIGLALFGITAFMAAYAVQEARIGRALVDAGVPAQALVVSAERIERSQCSRSQRAVCWAADNYIATVVYDVAGRRAGAELRLTADEFATVQSGTEVFIDLVYLPTDPPEVERAQGDRLARASSDMLSIYVLAAFGLTFTLIGSIALLVARKRAARPSTGQGR